MGRYPSVSVSADIESLVPVHGVASGTSRPPVLEPACSSSPSAEGFSDSSLLLPEPLTAVSTDFEPIDAFADPSLFTFGDDVEVDVDEGVVGVDADSLQPANHPAAPARIRPARHFFKFALKHMRSTFSERLGAL
jgi:hypothetical protein